MNYTRSGLASPVDRVRAHKRFSGPASSCRRRSQGFVLRISPARLTVLRLKQSLSTPVWETVHGASEAMAEGWVFFCVLVFVCEEC